MASGHARRDRLSGRVVAETLRYREVTVERAAGRSYREIATMVGYRSPSSVIDAIRSGIDRSGLRAGLAVVMRDRVGRLDDQLVALEPVIGHRHHDAPLLDATMMLHARLEFEADLAGPVPGVRDVAKLVAYRRPDLRASPLLTPVFRMPHEGSCGSEGYRPAPAVTRRWPGPGRPMRRPLNASA